MEQIVTNNKITQEELSLINEIRQQSMEIVYSLGELEFQKISAMLLVEELNLKIEDLKTKVKTIKYKEANLLDSFKTKYGNVNINLETGDFQ